jgi:hypothetical protein
MNLEAALDNARADRALTAVLFPRGLVMPAPLRTPFEAQWDRLERMTATAAARTSSFEERNDEMQFQGDAG